MKKTNIKNLILLTLMLSVTSIVSAVPAIPVPVAINQPDGDSLMVRIKGDERINWYESMDGYTLLFNEAGYLTYAQLDEDGNLKPSEMIATDIEKRSETVKSFLNTVEKKLYYSKEQLQLMQKIQEIEDDANLKKKQTKGGVIGNYKTICAFVQFPEKSMTKTMNQFQNLLNQIGYTGNGTGSVRDFFRESSYGQFDLTITLCGIYTAPNSESYYAGNEGTDKCNELGRWVVQQVANDPNINFTEYDSNNDGEVDGFHFIFAGRGQEAGGGSGTIWSHKWGFEPKVWQNGKYVEIYSCSPELLYYDITTIGVICHEMTHAFGELDFYDTDYDTDGAYYGTGEWDIMAGGSWNGYPGGNCPPHHNMYTKIKFGWVNPVILDSPTTISKMPNSAENPVAYRINTTTANEYFLLSNRQQIKFDESVPGNGLLIYRVHANVEGGDYNRINATHPQKMYPVCASSNYDIPTSDPYTYGYINSSGCTFPGLYDNFSFTDTYTPSMKSWAGNNTNKPITNIKNSNRFISFDFMGGGCPVVPYLTVNYTNNCEANISWGSPYSKSLKSQNGVEQENEIIFEETSSSKSAATNSPPKLAKASDNSDYIRLECTENVEDSRDQWIKWCGNNYDNVGSEGNINEFIVAARFTPQDLAAAGVKTGDIINHLKLVLYETLYCTFYVQFYSGGTSPSNPGTLVFEELIEGPLPDGQEVELINDNSYTIDASKELWIGYRIVVNGSNRFPAGCDAGPRVANKGDIIRWGGTWGTLYDLSAGTINANWNISALVESSSTGTATYSVYRDGNLIAENISETSFTDKGFSPNQGHTWAVKVHCESGGDSPLTSVNKESCKSGINDNINSSLTVYPNPTTGELVIRNEELIITNVELFDMFGNTFSISPAGGGRGWTSLNSNEIKLDISHLPNGIYFLKVNSKTVKIVKK